MRLVILMTTSGLLSASLALAGSDPGPPKAVAKPLAEVPFTLYQNGIIIEAGHDLNIGYGFMRKYVVTFDYPNKLITFEHGG